LFTPDDPQPVGVENPGARARFVLVCDHAGRAVPAALGRLGLPDAAFDLHIAWDIGALALSRRLSIALDACLIQQRYSRLVIDCNRAPGHEGLIAAVSDGVVVPANQGLSPSDAQVRVDGVHTPYHAKIAAEVELRAGERGAVALVCVHSFTPVFGGKTRPWHVGVLHNGASPSSLALLSLLRAEPGLVVGDNQPYAMDEQDYTAPHHAFARGLDALELEVRQDLLQDEEGSARIAELLARLLPTAIAASETA
jgi:predicted N-formylglutamate amidohydrolase